MRIKLLVLLCVICFSFSGCTPCEKPELTVEVKTLLTGLVTDSRAESINKLQEMGKDAIYFLIDRIDGDEIIDVGDIRFRYFMISNLNHSIMKTIGHTKGYNDFEGVLYVYLIDLMLNNEELVLHKSNDGRFASPVREYQREKYGFIYHRDDPKRDMTLEDMKAVKKMFQDWYEEHCFKSLKDLRETYKRGAVLNSSQEYVFK